MPTYEYKARSRFDVEQRIGQDREGGKVPHADSETPCLRCGHIKDFHCQRFRKGERPRSYLWAFDYPRPRFRAPVRCKHFDPSRPFEPPLCNSSACSVADCDCPGFVSPFRKPKKAAKPKPPATRKKRAAKPKAQTEQLAFPLSGSDFANTS